MSRSSASSRACRPVALPALLLLLLLFLSSFSASTVLGDDASNGRHGPARRLLVSLPSTHKTEQWMWVDGEKRPFRNDAGASLGERRHGHIPPRHWNPVHN